MKDNAASFEKRFLNVYLCSRQFHEMAFIFICCCDIYQAQERDEFRWSLLKFIFTSHVNTQWVALSQYLIFIEIL